MNVPVFIAATSGPHIQPDVCELVTLLESVRHSAWIMTHWKLYSILDIKATMSYMPIIGVSLVCRYSMSGVWYINNVKLCKVKRCTYSMVYVTLQIPVTYNYAICTHRGGTRHRSRFPPKSGMFG